VNVKEITIYHAQMVRIDRVLNLGVEEAGVWRT